MENVIGSHHEMTGEEFLLLAGEMESSQSPLSASISMCRCSAILMILICKLIL